MALITGQKLTKYYELYKNINITFNQEVIKTTGLNNKQVFIKCLGEQWRCALYSTSMAEAKVIISLGKEQFEKIKNANNLVALRYSFEKDKKEGPITFFVSAKIAGYNAYNKDNPDLNFLSLAYTQRPPDDHIAIIGPLLDANVNAKRRKDERIELSPENIVMLGIKTKATYIFIENIPRKCILRDISFSGAKIILPGVGKLLLKKIGILKIQFEDNNSFNLKGVIVRFEVIEERKDLTILALLFNPDSTPMEYKMKLNDFFSQTRKKHRSEST